MWPRRRNRAVSAAILLLFHASRVATQSAAMTVWILGPVADDGAPYGGS